MNMIGIRQHGRRADGNGPSQRNMSDALVLDPICTDQQRNVTSVRNLSLLSKMY